MNSTRKCQCLLLSLLSINVLVTTLPFKAAANPIATHRKGLDLGVHGGLNWCVPDGVANCDGFTVGGGVGALFGIRPIPYFSVDFDLGYYLVRQDYFDEAGVVDAMFLIMGYLPLQYVDIYGKIGWGYAAWRFLDIDSTRALFYSWANFKFGGGANFYFLNDHLLGDMGVGIDVSFLRLDAKKGKVCAGQDCSDFVDIGDADSADALQLSLSFIWIFPIFE